MPLVKALSFPKRVGLASDNRICARSSRPALRQSQLTTVPLCVAARWAWRAFGTGLLGLRPSQFSLCFVTFPLYNSLLICAVLNDSLFCTMLSTPSRATVIVSCIFPVLATVAVALRFYARRKKALSFRTDDYAVLLALVGSLGSLEKDAYLPSDRADNHNCYMRALHNWFVAQKGFSVRT